MVTHSLAVEDARSWDLPGGLRITRLHPLSTGTWLESAIPWSPPSHLDGFVGAASTADVPVLDANSDRIDSFVRALAGGVYSKIMTCNNALGCLDLARRHKPTIIFIHSSESIVEGVSLVELIQALSPQSDVRVLD